MSRMYDSRTTMFSPDGRLLQVEYAIEAVGHAGTCIGVTCPEGIILVAEKKSNTGLLDEDHGMNKIFFINEDSACALAGITCDANVLTNELRLIAQRYKLAYNDNIPIERMVRTLCDVKHSYTQFGGKRPFGVSLLYIGYDKQNMLQLYQSDPSGNYSGWKANCIGGNSSAAQAHLDMEWKGHLTLDAALHLAIQTLMKTLDAVKLKANNLEVVTLTRKDGKTVLAQMPHDQLNRLIGQVEQEEKEKSEKARLESLANRAGRYND